MRRENTMDQHDSTEAPLCDACRRIPISHLSLDASEPLVGWSAFFEERYITVMDDSLGRPSVARHVVADLLVSEHDWSWVMLELAEEGLPVTKVPRSPQRLALQWQQFSDAITEKRLTHGPDPVLARHAANLGLISGAFRAPTGPGRWRGSIDRVSARGDDQLRRRDQARTCATSEDPRLQETGRMKSKREP
jgi:hypothetical protein